MSNKLSTWREIPVRAFLGFVIAAVVGPLVAHIPPHIGWLSFVAGVVAAAIVGLIFVRNEMKADREDLEKLTNYALHLAYFILGGCVGGIVGVLAAYFIK